MGLDGTTQWKFTACCNCLSLQEFTEIQVPWSSLENLRERGSICTVLRDEVQFSEKWDLSSAIAAFPVDVRYIRHCIVKGWKPSLRGLQSFIKMERLGYYKTL